jgi:hypothetical protein
LSASAQPVQSLAREIAGAARGIDLTWTASDVRRRIEAGGLAETVDDLLLEVGGGRRRLLVVVDQCEELLTRGDSVERGRFAEVLRPALGRSVHLVVTLRPEFLDPLLAAPELDALPRRVHPLQPLRREALRAVITEPARLAGLGIDEDLVDTLVADTEDGKALPLLAYTLARLSAELRRNDRLLSSRYEQLGGVRGTLVRQADAALVEAMTSGGRTESQVIRELLRLVTVDQQDRPSRRRVPWDELSPHATAELTPFVERRLLTTDTENDRSVIGVAHEAFLSACPRCEMRSPRPRPPCGRAVPWSRPPTAGSMPGERRRGCGSVDSSPPRWPTPARRCAARRILWSGAGRTRRRGRVRAWSANASNSAPGPATSCSRASATIVDDDAAA